VLLRRMMIFLLAMFMLASSQVCQAAGGVPVLCYHDIGSNKADPLAVSREGLERHFQYLQRNGYQPISIQEFAAAVEGRQSLPEKPVLLTFDDGYASFYTNAYPLLQKYRYPAVLSVVTSWIENQTPPPGTEVMTWEQIRETESSGLVTVASHSHAQHKYLQAAPKGFRPALTTLEYHNGRYETQEEYRIRVTNDMDINQDVFNRRIGHPVTLFTWPYGEYTKIAAEIGRSRGYRVFLTLQDGLNPMDRAVFNGVNRTMVYGNMDEKALAQLLSTGGQASPQKLLRVAQMDLDLLYDDNPAMFETNIETALATLKRSNVNTVFLQAFVDNNATGNAEEMYFSSRVSPTKKDVFDYVVQRLHGSRIQVYAWIPTLANQWLLKDHSEDEVTAVQSAGKGWYRRATPFSPRVKAELKEFVRDLASRSMIDGVLFQDDAYMTDMEDSSPAAQTVFKAHFGKAFTAETLQVPAIVKEWANLKNQAMNDLTKELMEEVRRFRPQAKFARNMYVPVLLNPDSEDWFAQNYQDYLKLYDYTVIMAYTKMDKIKQPEAWLAKIAKTVSAQPGAMDKTIVKIQAYDWDTRQWLVPWELNREVQSLRENGILHIGVYPSNVLVTRGKPLPF